MTQVAVFPAADADIVTVSSFSISFTANAILPFSSTVIISGLSEVQVTTVHPPIKISEGEPVTDSSGRTSSVNLVTVSGVTVRESSLTSSFEHAAKANATAAVGTPP